VRKALIVGINYYRLLPTLHGCVNDAYAVKSVLEKHADGSVNFGVRLLASAGQESAVGRAELKESIRELFSEDSEIALLYFAGHGHLESVGGYLCTSDCRTGDDGVSLSEVLAMGAASPARNKIFILDSCHSGVAGTSPVDRNTASLSQGMTILTASTAEQYASESNGSGTFTALLVDALNGGAGNLVGAVTPGGVYAHIDQSLGPWKQRPVFRTNVKSFVCLRRVVPPIELRDLQRLSSLFPSAGFEYQLDPTFEPEPTGRPPGSPDPISANTEVFAILQKLYRVNLVTPVGASSMWHAAMNRRSCKLTVLGEHYRRLVNEGLL
jgi:hypothetical protein